jgi:hypothetical protein
VLAVHLQKIGHIDAGNAHGHQDLHDQLVSRWSRHVGRGTQPRSQFICSSGGDSEPLLRAVALLAVGLDELIALQALEREVDLANVEWPHLARA